MEQRKGLWTCPYILLFFQTLEGGKEVKKAGRQTAVGAVPVSVFVTKKA